MCHLGGFTGQNEIPRVAGQQYAYIVKQLADFRRARRTNDAGNMTSVAKTLSAQDIDEPGALPGRALTRRARPMATTTRAPALERAGATPTLDPPRRRRLAPLRPRRRVLHWLIGVLLLAEIAFGFLLDEIAPRGTPSRAGVINLHKSFGIVLGVLILVRLAWRLGHRRRRGRRRCRRGGSAPRRGHVALYACMAGHAARRLRRLELQQARRALLRPRAARRGVLTGRRCTRSSSACTSPAPTC